VAACALQSSAFGEQIIMRRFLYFPHRRATMFRETIERAQIRQGAQLIFR